MSSENYYDALSGDNELTREQLWRSQGELTSPNRIQQSLNSLKGVLLQEHSVIRI